MKWAILLLALGFCACKTRQEINSNVTSLSDDDLRMMFAARDKFDESTHKVMIFIEAENELTNGGEPFYREYMSLLKNNLGHNYSVYVLTSAPEDSDFVGELKNHLKHPEDRDAKEGSLVYLDIGVTKTSIQRLMDRVTADLNKLKSTKTESSKNKQSQVLLHFLAHGMSFRGKGDGFVSVSDQGILTWRELADSVLEPLAKSANETIAVVESCFGGNVLPQLANDFFYRNNVMLVVGAPVWTSQLAVTGESATGNVANSELIKRYFRSSVASLSLKAALMGYASEGLLMSDENAGVPDDSNALVGDEHGQPLPFFDGTSLKEKFVVRVDEFVKYVTKKGKHINCEFMLHKQFRDVKQICSSGKVPKVGLSFTSVPQTADSNARLPVWLQDGKAGFIRNFNQANPIPEVYVFSTKLKNATLNPVHGPKSNAVLSVASLSLTDAGDDALHRQATLPRDGIAGLDVAIAECQASLDKLTGDMYDVLRNLAGTQSLYSASSTTAPSTTPGSSNPVGSGGKPKICNAYE